MDLRYLCTTYPKIMRIILSLLLFSGLLFIIVAIIVIIEYKDDYLDGLANSWKFIKGD